MEVVRNPFEIGSRQALYNNKAVQSDGSADFDPIHTCQ